MILIFIDMVKTRGSRFRRRLTTCACRERATVQANEDEQHQVVDEVCIPPLDVDMPVPREPFPGGPNDTLVLRSFKDYVDAHIWIGKVIN